MSNPNSNQKTLSKSQYFEHLQKIKNRSTYKNPAYICVSNTNLDLGVHGSHSTLDHFLFMNKTEEVKPIL